MSNGHEEQNVLNKCNEIINYTIGKLALENPNVNTNSVDSVETGITNASVRVRMNNTIQKALVEEERPVNKFYTNVPTYTINQTPSNISGNKSAFAAVLMVMEILALIILVTLVTFVVFYGLS